MGRIGRFFKNIWNGVKNGATKVWNFGKNVVAPKVVKVIKKIPEIVDKVTGITSLIPGKAGLVSSFINRGANAIKGLTDMLPDGQAKTKINEAINKGVDTGQNIIDKGTNAITNITNKAQPWLNAASNISNHIVGGVRKIGVAPDFKMPPRGIPAGFNPAESRKMLEQFKKGF